MTNSLNEKALLTSSARPSFGALAAGFGLASLSPLLLAQTMPDTELPEVKVKARATAVSGKVTLQATTTAIGKGQQALRDIPQSVTVVTEKLMDDRQLDTLKDALKNTAGISFLAAEGGEEDIRLRGFSLQSTGDVFIDGMRDPAFYERDSFSWDRLEVLRGSASMLFGRGSTGGAVNQVSKQARLMNQHEVALTVGTDGYRRVTADFNQKTGDDAALRLNLMNTKADQSAGGGISKHGVAGQYRLGIGTRDEWSVGVLHLRNHNGVNYGLAWLTPGVSGGNRLWPNDPNRYYGAASDYNQTGTTQGTLSHIHRFSPQQTLKTQVRYGAYARDLRASAIRFANASLQPNRQAVTSDNFGESTVLTRGTNNKLMGMNTWSLQSDYSGQHQLAGMTHHITAGMDAAHERFSGYALTLPLGVSFTKPTTTVGSPNDGGEVDETMRQPIQNRAFTARAIGIYAQDLIQMTPHWKILGGLRWDRFAGTYQNLSTAPAAANNPCSAAPLASYSRDDQVMSHRVGVLYQPTDRQSYHFSYGTSFNTSGDTYQYDPGTAQTEPESSRNMELGAKIDSADGRFTTRVAIFKSIKYNERNRDTESVNACNYVLSGQRHAAGVEWDLAGRITPKWEVFGSYAYIPVAKVDRSSGAAGTDVQGSRPGLTPKHTGTIWTTYQVTPTWRLGAGINARSSDRPAGLAASSPVIAPAFVTADLMAEYVWNDLTIKANLSNVSNRHYADAIYRGHYIPGRGRVAQVTASYQF